MRISIRPDYCIALRMIAIQEYHRKSQEFLNEVLGDIEIDLDELEDHEDAIHEHMG